MAKQWSERVEELLEEGDRQGAIKVLEDVVERIESENGAAVNLSLAAAMGDLAALYEHDGLSLKADSLRRSAIVIKLKAQGFGSRVAGVEEEEDWEKAEFEDPRGLGTSKPETANGEIVPKQRGRGSFTYGTSGLYCDNFRGRRTRGEEEDGEDEVEEGNSCLNYGVYGAGHALVIEGFSPKTTTRDLEQLVKPFANRGVVIRWINDTSALAVFQNPTIAREALNSIRNPSYTLKAYDESVAVHALVCEKDLEPPAPRPKTSVGAAQRMIIGALAKQGVKVENKLKSTAEDLQKQKNERKQRLFERERLREEAWGD